MADKHTNDNEWNMKKHKSNSGEPVLVIVLSILLTVTLLAMAVLYIFKDAIISDSNSASKEETLYEENAIPETDEYDGQKIVNGERTETSKEDSATADNMTTVDAAETGSIAPVDDTGFLDSLACKQVKYDEVDFSEFFDISHAGETEENPELRMSHTIYADAELSDTSGRFKAFLIDFKADYAGMGTCWGLCNFDLDTSYLKKEYENISGGGAYCGLYASPEGNGAMMEYWDIECDDTVITPELVSDDNLDYAWESGKWYRMLIQCVKDKESGNTFIEMWMMDIAEDKWNKICVYDTHMKKTCFTGGMSQDMWNSLDEYSNELRSFQYANLAVKDGMSNKWVPITKSYMCVDTWWNDKKGTFAFGSTSTNLWGITCGYGEDSAELGSDISSWENVVSP